MSACVVGFSVCLTYFDCMFLCIFVCFMFKCMCVCSVFNPWLQDTFPLGVGVEAMSLILAYLQFTTDLPQKTQFSPVLIMMHHVITDPLSDYTH